MQNCVVNSSEKLEQPNKSSATNEPKDVDTLLAMLVQAGFTNTIQNIIVLKRFNNNYDQAINYLKSSSTS